MTVLSLIEYFFDNLFPSHCLMCNKTVKHQPKLCTDCLSYFAKLPFPTNGVNFLLKPNISRLFKEIYFESLFAVSWYQEPSSHWLSQLKFCNKIHYRHVLIQIIQAQLMVAVKNNNWLWPDMIIIMPLHLRRYKMRGFNQVDQVWRKALLSIPGFDSALIKNDVLKRKKYTKAQTNLSAKQRQKNLTSAFSIHADVKNKTIVIIDDVITTGATVNEVSLCFKHAGAKQVWVWATCITPQDK